MADSNGLTAMEYSKCNSSHNGQSVDNGARYRTFTANLNTVIEAMELHPEFITYLLNARRPEQNQTKIPSEFVVDTAKGLRFLVGFMKSFQKHPVTTGIVDERKKIENTPPVGSDTSIDLAAAFRFAIDSMEQLRNDNQLNQNEPKTEGASQFSSKLSLDQEGGSVSETVLQKHEKTKLQEKPRIVSQEPTSSAVVDSNETFSLTPKPPSKPKTSSLRRHKVVYTPPPKDYKMYTTTFDGAKGNDADCFIVALEAYKDWGQISDEQTYNELHTLLVKNALTWWKKHKHIGYINTWEEAKKEMRIMFTEWPPHRIFKQLLKMKQGNQRSLHYFRKVESLLKRLPEGYISEAAKIDLVYCQTNDKIRRRVPRCILNNVEDLGIHGHGIEEYNSLGVIRREEDFLYIKSTKDDDTATEDYYVY